MEQLKKDNSYFYELIKYKKPYIYKINDEYYYLGAGVFKKCNDEEISLYEDFTKELNIVKGIEYKKKEDFVKFNEYYERIVNRGDFVFNDEAVAKAINNLASLLKYLNEDEMESLYKQNDDFELACKLYGKYQSIPPRKRVGTL